MQGHWIELIILVAVISPLLAYYLAMINVCFTFLESGNIKYIYRGDTLKKILADVKGKKISSDGHTLVDVDGTEEKHLWEKWFGVYWIGLWPFASVKRFKIKRRKEEEDTSGKPKTAWIRTLDTIEVDSLRAAFPRPFLMEKVELGDRQTVDILLVGKFHVVDAYIPVPELKGEFFELTSSTLRGAVIDRLELIPDMDEFIKANKGEGEGAILEHLTKPDGPFNTTLAKRVGLHLVGITIPEWDPSDTKVRDAMSKKFIAEKEGEATEATAKAYARSLGLSTTADAARIRDLGIARGGQIKEAVAAFGSGGGDKTIALRAAADVLEMEAATSETSKIETLVQGGGTPPVLPIK